MPTFLDLPDLRADLCALLAQVPAGRVTTCGALAEALGSRHAAVWIGHYLLHHEHTKACACHRVVRAGGVLGPYVQGTVSEKAARLAQEGVVVSGETVDLKETGTGSEPSMRGPAGSAGREVPVPISSLSVDLARYGFEHFTSSRPLERLRRVQEEMAKHASLRPPKKMPPLVGGVDAAYTAADEGQAAYALVDSATGEMIWSATVRRRVEFPYISTFLSFRELPLLLAVLDEARAAGKLAEVVMVDGSGILHQHRAGIATHLGVTAGLPTIGVTKKLLCGKVDIADMRPGESRPVAVDRRALGVALRPTSGSRRPIFISPGHRCNVAFAEVVVRQMLRGHRLPEPLYWADKLSRCPASRDR